MYFVELFLLGISLSMDAFSLAASLSVNIKSYNKYSFCVGIFHFFMPLLGVIVGRCIKKIIYIPSDEIFICVLVFIILGILFDKKTNLERLINPFLFAFTVSIDSFSVGLSISNNYLVPPLIFTICSIFFSKLGFYLGKRIKSSKFIHDKLISVLILVFLIIYNILT